MLDSCNDKGCGICPCLRPGRRFVLISVPVRRNVRNPFYLCFEKGFVVALISKVDYKSVSEPYVIVLVRANAAKAKCKAETYAYQRSLM